MNSLSQIPRALWNTGKTTYFLLYKEWIGKKNYGSCRYESVHSKLKIHIRFI